MELPVWVVDKALKYRRKGGVFNPNEHEADAVFAIMSSTGELPVLPHIFKSHMEKEDYNDMTVIKLGGDKDSETAVIYYHGGGYVGQISKHHFDLCDKIAGQTGVHVFIPDYPLAPSHTAVQAYDLLIPMYEDIVSKYKKVILMGDSAGGGLALGIATNTHIYNLKAPEQIILISPWLNLEMDGFDESAGKEDKMLSLHGLDICGKAWAGELSYKDPRISPIYGDLKNIGSMTIFTGTHDLLNRDAHLLKDKCDKEGIELNFIEREGLCHVYMLTPVKQASEDFIIVKELIEKASELH